LPITDGTWFILAAILLLAVILIPGTVVFWFFGLAGFLVGGTMLLLDPLLLDFTWQWQFIAFAMSGIVLVVLWARLDRPAPDGNIRAEQPFRSGPYVFVGQVFRLHKPIVDGIGIVTIGGTIWRVAGRNCAAGRQVKVLRTEGTLLIVDPLET
jgi:membrane protein implicated in regulation of membrane protease activity